ncbi:MAG: hypothetical protein KA051_02495, partial [Paludibacteraceae bacterium]|nr:hypothetical protein [Paludibacteraceae bacterium]
PDLCQGLPVCFWRKYQISPYANRLIIGYKDTKNITIIGRLTLRSITNRNVRTVFRFPVLPSRSNQIDARGLVMPIFDFTAATEN